LLRRICAGLALVAACGVARAEKDGLLYDPQPPANSAYVRLINAVPEATFDVSIDGNARLSGLRTGDASDYLVLPAGKRALGITSAKGPKLNVNLDVAAGRAMTLAIHSLRPGAPPWIFEDKANTNNLKSILAVYYHAHHRDALDVLTADGKIKVFAGVKPSSSAGISVNPIKVDLIAAPAGSTQPLARASLAMAPGGTYSVLLFPGPRGELTARALHNKVERYTGKPAPPK
jgi:alginate O-acetyltransferase complex protein AlgF